MHPHTHSDTFDHFGHHDFLTHSLSSHTVLVMTQIELGKKNQIRNILFILRAITNERIQLLHYSTVQYTIVYTHSHRHSKDDKHQAIGYRVSDVKGQWAMVCRGIGVVREG